MMVIRLVGELMAALQITGLVAAIRDCCASARTPRQSRCLTVLAFVYMIVWFSFKNSSQAGWPLYKVRRNPEALFARILQSPVIRYCNSASCMSMQDGDRIE